MYRVFQKSLRNISIVVQNLTLSGVYLRSTLSNTPLLLLTTTGSEFSVATMDAFLMDHYDALEETLTYMKILKLKSYQESQTMFIENYSHWNYRPWLGH